MFYWPISFTQLKFEVICRRIGDIASMLFGCFSKLRRRQWEFENSFGERQWKITVRLLSELLLSASCFNPFWNEATKGIIDYCSEYPLHSSFWQTIIWTTIRGSQSKRIKPFFEVFSIWAWSLCSSLVLLVKKNSEWELIRLLLNLQSKPGVQEQPFVEGYSGYKVLTLCWVTARHTGDRRPSI